VLAIAMGEHPIAVVYDLVQPIRARSAGRARPSGAGLRGVTWAFLFGRAERQQAALASDLRTGPI
jgi:hypothetical protein